ncbi:hypothetical protein [Micromonospora schwarzwaldensis]|uniref:hypothetical protein n=1 Tax=Micromonospora sp. DSM 45708 TaxID=3111767 RepID=UPI0031DE0A9C
MDELSAQLNSDVTVSPPPRSGHPADRPPTDVIRTTGPARVNPERFATAWTSIASSEWLPPSSISANDLDALSTIAYPLTQL